MKSPAPESRFLFLGGFLWIDFVNTQVVENEKLADRIANFSDWLNWLEVAGTLPARAPRNFPRVLTSVAIGRFFPQVPAFRQELRRAARQLTEKREFPPRALAAVNRFLAFRLSYPQLVRENREFRRREIVTLESPEQLLAPIAESVSQFLLSADLTLLKKCENPRCVLYFYDATKSHTRRWCSMDACGNRSKVASYYQRKREAKLSGEKAASGPAETGAELTSPRAGESRTS